LQYHISQIHEPSKQQFTHRFRSNTFTTKSEDQFLPHQASIAVTAQKDWKKTKTNKFILNQMAMTESKELFAECTGQYWCQSIAKPRRQT
jgi:hypothetical protein